MGRKKNREVNNKWETFFYKEKQNLEKVLQGNYLNIFHISSPSAMCIDELTLVDILLVVKNIDDLDEEQLISNGYDSFGAYGLLGRKYFTKEQEGITYQVHGFQVDDTTDIRRHLAFRDYLISHPGEADIYQQLKSQLDKNPTSQINYQMIEKSIWEEIEKKALHYLWENVSN